MVITHADRPADMKVKIKKAKMEVEEQHTKKAVLDHIDTSLLSLHD
jgi:hypothetical protein